jgi:twitching motility two-component system response regulator PilG
MTQRQYQAQQLSTLLETLQSKVQSGTLRINAFSKVDRLSRCRILVYQSGEITYAGSNLPPVPKLAHKLIQQFKPSLGETTLKFVREKVTNPTSARELFALLCKIRALSWEQIESYFQTQVAITLEQLLPYAGQFEFNPTVEFDLTYGDDLHGLNPSKLKFELARRQEQWLALTPTISSMEAIPSLSQGGLEAIANDSAQLHAKQYIDGKNSIVEIAERSGRDPLALAQLYLTWSQANWIVFEETYKVNKPKNLPTILSVDDSPIVQTMIKRTLGDRYQVLLASNAVDALNLLNQKQVSLLLLDVTMPDIDGLEMCRTLRSIPKFCNLPIVMLTARDTFVDKIKGQIAGTNCYLTKPFEASKLLDIIENFVSN